MAYLSKEHQVRSFKPKKEKRKKKPVVDGKTPIPEGKKVCACGCGRTTGLSIHHVYGKSARRFSNRFKCVEWTCWHSHQGPHGIHGAKDPDIDLDYKLKCKHQQRLMNDGMSIVGFIFYFGMDYIGLGLEGYRQYRSKAM